jgi:hypothetical protein
VYGRFWNKKNLFLQQTLFCVLVRYSPSIDCQEEKKRFIEEQLTSWHYSYTFYL